MDCRTKYNKLGFANYPKTGPEYPACRFGRVPGYPTITCFNTLKKLKCIGSQHETTKLLIWPGQINGVDICIKRDTVIAVSTAGRVYWVCCVDISMIRLKLPPNGKRYSVHRWYLLNMLSVFWIQIKSKIEIISGRQKCCVLRGLVLQVVIKVVILADCPGTREAHFSTGTRPDSRVPG